MITKKPIPRGKPLDILKESSRKEISNKRLTNLHFRLVNKYGAKSNLIRTLYNLAAKEGAIELQEFYLQFIEDPERRLQIQRVLDLAKKYRAELTK